MTTIQISQTEDGLRVASTDIAQGAGVEHQATLKLIQTHAASLEEFGRVGFQIRPLATAGGTQQQRVAMLNEHQSTLLLTMMRNTPQVVAFKVALVKAFFEMAQQLVKPRELSRTELAQWVIEAEAEKAAAQARAAELEAPAAAWGVMVSAEGDYSVDEAAKILSRDMGISTGRNRLFSFMQELGWIYRRGPRNQWHAYQEQVENGRLHLKASAAFLNQKTMQMEVPAPTIRITAKGLEALFAKLSRQMAVA
ncbi:hypothetical protein C6401_10825 [Arthrobacter woluwensis]|uniref:phage regulatory protein/antirepressor Ant n=1 Tax=Arthrobacter woluwensis TaxID=156980 RepID=UPI000D1331D3|nr:phage regulatory protein/antirepressor Ant [Arthrobacter woluwensis]PSS43618.1 hypothetical protein C6401_10825 [Arthrobacter woluwensis]